ncbi:hypothetical protein [Methanococcoides sp. AM1]|uniref:hypothetical protein n=1 Tax=Methanococcoides sp. AM1 TaxID=1201011 RepID=UPI0010835ED3|nr:hypothetical protein [Methanococcoides sp. AM1]
MKLFILNLFRNLPRDVLCSANRTAVLTAKQKIPHYVDHWANPSNKQQQKQYPIKLLDWFNFTFT